MRKITEEQYEFALARIEELLPLVTEETPANDRNAVELTMMSDIVIEYEKEHYPIAKPSVADLIELSLEEKEMTQRQLASLIGVSPSRVNDYVSGRADIKDSTFALPYFEYCSCGNDGMLLAVAVNDILINSLSLHPFFPGQGYEECGIMNYEIEDST